FDWKPRAAAVYSLNLPCSHERPRSPRPDPLTTDGSPDKERSPPMSANLSAPRIGIYGSDGTGSCHESRGCYLWPPGYAAAVTAAGGEPTPLDAPPPGGKWGEDLSSVEGVLFLGHAAANARRAAL